MDCHSELLEHRGVNHLGELVIYSRLCGLGWLLSALWETADGLSAWHWETTLASSTGKGLASWHWETSSTASTSTTTHRLLRLLYSRNPVNQVVNRTLPIIKGSLKCSFALVFRESHIHKILDGITDLTIPLNQLSRKYRLSRRGLCWLSRLILIISWNLGLSLWL